MFNINIKDPHTLVRVIECLQDALPDIELEGNFSAKLFAGRYPTPAKAESSAKDEMKDSYVTELETRSTRFKARSAQLVKIQAEVQKRCDDVLAPGGMVQYFRWLYNGRPGERTGYEQRLFAEQLVLRKEGGYRRWIRALDDGHRWCLQTHTAADGSPKQ